MNFPTLNRRIRMALLAGVSATAILTASANAETMNQGRLWLELSGVGPFWYASNKEVYIPGTLEIKPKYGMMLSGEIGYQFAESPYSIALRVGHGWSKRRSSSFSTFSSFSPSTGVTFFNGGNGSVQNKEKLTFLDFEVGRDVGLGNAGGKLRIHAGLRFASFRSKESGYGSFFGYNGTFYSTFVTSKLRRKFTGIGPRVGFNSLTPVSESLALRLDAAGALLFGKRKTTAIETYVTSFGSSFTSATRRSKSTVIPNISAYAGFAWTPASMPGMTISLGYSVDAYFNIAETWNGTSFRKSDRIIHGPKLSIRFDF